MISYSLQSTPTKQPCLIEDQLQPPKLTNQTAMFDRGSAIVSKAHQPNNRTRCTSYFTASAILMRSHTHAFSLHSRSRLVTAMHLNIWSLLVLKLLWINLFYASYVRGENRETDPWGWMDLLYASYVRGETEKQTPEDERTSCTQVM